MSELRRDPVVGRWVIIDTDNPKKPEDFQVDSHHYDDPTNCPFCYGNEYMTPPEIQAVRHEKTLPNTPGWQVRTIPNKFPALQIEGDLDRRGIGIFDISNGIGAHEVIIETPYHTKDISDLELDEIEKILSMYVMRYKDLEKDKRFKYIMLFKNFGSSAGATIDHNHAQLIALPMIPKNVLEEITGAMEYYEFRDRCIFCDMIRQEIEEKERILATPEIEEKEGILATPEGKRLPVFELTRVKALSPEDRKVCYEALIHLRKAQHSTNFKSENEPKDKLSDERVEDITRKLFAAIKVVGLCGSPSFLRLY